MAEYIDRDILFEQIRLTANKSCLGETSVAEISAMEIVNVIANMPAADVVEIVRCKDCLYNENGTCVHSESYDDTTHRPDYFCADGIRKEVQE